MSIRVTQSTAFPHSCLTGMFILRSLGSPCSPSPVCSIYHTGSRLSSFSSPSADPSWSHLASSPLRFDSSTTPSQLSPHSSPIHSHPSPRCAIACWQASLFPSLPAGIVFTETTVFSQQWLQTSACLLLTQVLLPQGLCQKCSPPGTPCLLLDSGASSFSTRLPCPDSLKMQSSNMGSPRVLLSLPSLFGTHCMFTDLTTFS